SRGGPRFYEGAAPAAIPFASASADGAPPRRQPFARPHTGRGHTAGSARVCSKASETEAHIEEAVVRVVAVGASAELEAVAAGEAAVLESVAREQMFPAHPDEGVLGVVVHSPEVREPAEIVRGLFGPGAEPRRDGHAEPADVDHDGQVERLVDLLMGHLERRGDLFRGLDVDARAELVEVRRVLEDVEGPGVSDAREQAVEAEARLGTGERVQPFEEGEVAVVFPLEVGGAGK